MAPTALPSTSWSQQFYAAFYMLENDKPGCIPLLQAILSESSVPRHWRIQALIALASAVEDWYEAEGYQQEAEILWRSTRIMFPKGCDDEMDGLLARSRVLLDHLAHELDDTMPDGIRLLREQAEEEDEQETDGEDQGTSDDDEDEDDDSEVDGPDDGWNADGGQDEEDEVSP
ncbi:hypothetical protein QM012_003278 [Aureobasidium pullulans]|uniref:Uncharacterized protein n=1 Tax=Aureobasidium pullulans TaxID=5580 RepID=A0ABR0TB35_AURPU